MANSFRLVKESAGCPSADKKLKVDGKEVGCTLTVATFNSNLDAVADMPDWMGGKKDIRFIRSIQLMFQGVKADGTPFLTPSREDVLKIAEQASGDQIFGYYSFEVGFELSSPTLIFLPPENRAVDLNPKSQFGLEVAKKSGRHASVTTLIDPTDFQLCAITVKTHFGLDSRSGASASSPYFAQWSAFPEPPLPTPSSDRRGSPASSRASRPYK